MYTLKIGRRLRADVATLAEARALYERERDGSGEGASTFPDGVVKTSEFLIGMGATFRISYNGRIWSGETEVRV